MARFVDRLLRERVFDGSAFSGTTEDYAQFPVFDVTNVVRYLDANPVSRESDVVDFPCLFPPYPRFFVEYRDANGITVGVLVQAKSGVPPLPAEGTVMDTSSLDEGKRTNEGWSFFVALFSLDSRDVVVRCPLVSVYFVSKDGELLTRDGKNALIATTTYQGEPPLSTERSLEVRRYLRAFLDPVLFSISLVNFKNITTELREPDEKVRRKALKRYGVEPVTYRVLTIDATKTKRRVKRATPTEIETCRTNAAHDCRAHRKTYTSDAPLFGKYVGTWWWGPQFDRGDATKPKVKHDYEVKR